MTRSTDITSFTEYRQHLRHHLERVQETGRPLYVTTNGKTDAVVLSPEAYDALVGKAELVDTLTALERSAEDMREGRVQSAKAGLQRIAAELGLTLQR